jgi:hypothetical protein
MTALAPSVIRADVLSIDDIMGQREQEASGVDRLTPPEKQALELWVTQWTRKVISQAPTYHPSMSLSQWVHSWPGYINPRPVPQAEAVRERQKANQKVFRNLNGAALELYDGSVWNVTQIDQPVALYWARGQRISISTNSMDTVRPFILFNEARKEQVGATQAQRPNPQGQRPPDNPAYFRGSVVIGSITPDGITITLTTGDVWIIAPTGQQIVQATWKIRDRLRIERSSDAAYRYLITNLDSGTSALANPPNKDITPSYYQQ